ncbi:phosphoadenosine phosphosulfate reductase [Roseobacter sp.]|uniref:phosphoadenosine phosphosulfate reductase n=1 Tax=Roseobacter sp. TaxID=1907202 RepID=UPI0032986258
MLNSAPDFEQSLQHRHPADWVAAARTLIQGHGTLTPLGPDHVATFINSGPTLLVSFETHRSMQTLSRRGHPLGWDMMQRVEWSHLGLISDGDTWFRDPAIYTYFDTLVDDGFFDRFETVLFYGAGPCGYAAAAFSVAAPGARVLAIQPQATLDPQITGWDTRFTAMRRTSFSDRYGYAPDMLDAAAEAFVLFDPVHTADAMHAALFTKPNVTKLRMRRMGADLQADLNAMHLLPKLIAHAGRGTLNDGSFAQLMRARRDHMPYLRRLLVQLDDDQRPILQRLLCQSVVRRHNAPRFARRLDLLAPPVPA